MTKETTLNQSLIGIQIEIVHLSRLVNQAIIDALRALIERDEPLARRVGADDVLLNQARLGIEETIATLLVSSGSRIADPRMIAGAVNVVTNLERIGDHAAGVARLALRMNRAPYPAAIRHIPPMAETARELVEGAVSAFLAQDSRRAEEVVRRDREIDDLYEQVIHDLADLMVCDPAQGDPAMLLMWTAHNLERIGERAANICERTIYVVTGELKEFG
jgi:phosphate transport system protein